MRKFLIVALFAAFATSASSTASGEPRLATPSEICSLVSDLAMKAMTERQIGTSRETADQAAEGMHARLLADPDTAPHADAFVNTMRDMVSEAWQTPIEPDPSDKRLAAIRFAEKHWKSCISGL